MLKLFDGKYFFYLCSNDNLIWFVGKCSDCVWKICEV